MNIYDYIYLFTGSDPGMNYNIVMSHKSLMVHQFQIFIFGRFQFRKNSIDAYLEFLYFCFLFKVIIHIKSVMKSLFYITLLFLYYQIKIKIWIIRIKLCFVMKYILLIFFSSIHFLILLRFFLLLFLKAFALLLLIFKNILLFSQKRKV